MISDQIETRCPVCSSNNLQHLVSLHDVPVFCNVLLDTPEKAKRIAKGQIELTICKRCTHIFNRAFDAALLQYSGEYDNSLHYSEHFQAYTAQLIQDLVERHQLYDKRIIEIACGKGIFLNRLCVLGDNQGIGFDPSYQKSRAPDDLQGNVVIVKDYYDAAHADLNADFICCRHALEHIEHPVDFLATIRTSLNECDDTVLFFELPNVLYTLRDLGIWDIIYEHCGYFNDQSLCRAFQQSGFEVCRLDSAYGDQYLTIEAKPNISNKPMTTPAETKRPAESIWSYADTFAARYAEKVEQWQVYLEGLSRTDKRVLVWGAGSKGITFLNLMQCGSTIGAIVDVNPYKQGKFVPGTATPVVSPQFVRDYRPNVVIVMNPLYTPEVKASLRQMNVQAEVVEG